MVVPAKAGTTHSLGGLAFFLSALAMSVAGQNEKVSQLAFLDRCRPRRRTQFCTAANDAMCQVRTFVGAAVVTSGRGRPPPPPHDRAAGPVSHAGLRYLLAGVKPPRRTPGPVFSLQPISDIVYFWAEPPVSQTRQIA
jgi:hypothetical protein